MVMDLIFEHVKADKGIVFMLDAKREQLHKGWLRLTCHYSQMILI